MSTGKRRSLLYQWTRIREVCLRIYSRRTNQIISLSRGMRIWELRMYASNKMASAKPSSKKPRTKKEKSLRGDAGYIVIIILISGTNM